MITLGIETSCDETAVSVLKNGKILSNEVASSLRFHKQYGGIVPEIATRYHIETIDAVCNKALIHARIKRNQIDLIAFTYGPGLVGSLLVGISFAKALGYSLGVPILGINHLQAHTFSACIGKKSIPFPCISLIISGGHTCLAYVKDADSFTLLGQTTDDAAGEAFDKVSKILGFGYPGGPIIESLAQKGDPEKTKFSYTKGQMQSLDFTFSGLKTAVLYYVRDAQARNKKIRKVDVASTFQKIIIETLFEKVKLACTLKKTKTIVIGGGVSINRALREYFTKSAHRYDLEVIFPDSRLCLDNGAMVAALGEYLFRKKRFISDFYVSAISNLGFDSNYKGDGYGRFRNCN
ncbi:MAG: tRNA (adenosine(37)-N6)-threonylcarbamoyltransferase complex transferase subunit TsaD [Candidatus Omnitrophota bacterium]